MCRRIASGGRPTGGLTDRTFAGVATSAASNADQQASRKAARRPGPAWPSGQPVEGQDLARCPEVGGDVTLDPLDDGQPDVPGRQVGDQVPQRQRDSVPCRPPAPRWPTPRRRPARHQPGQPSAWANTLRFGPTSSPTSTRPPTQPISAPGAVIGARRRRLPATGAGAGRCGTRAAGCASRRASLSTRPRRRT